MLNSYLILMLKKVYKEL